MRNTLEDAEAIGLLARNYIGQLAYLSGACPYIVPITYFYDKENNRIISYSSEGHKLTAMRKKPDVVLGVQDIKSVANWESIQIHGNFEELSGLDAKHSLYVFAEGVKAIINTKNVEKTQFISDFSAKIESEKVSVTYQINITSIIGVVRKT